MTASDFDRLEKLFHGAKSLSPGQRTLFLDRECAGDVALRADVDSLLRSHDAASSEEFLEEPATGVEATMLDPNLEAQTLVRKCVGPYRIERFVGGGGMGDVYLAIREEPFRQHVALKITRKATSSFEILRRFDFERQILASLNHTNIAKLLDGGVTKDGLPYFAMEYVDGLPITRYADRNKLTIRERLVLFTHVCSAVQYAHNNLVIHRDLKPPNILVTKEGVVKLLDFGIAKIINPNLADVPAAVTQTQFRMLTPDYASPEQVRGEPLSTASDVYSLGIVLYELLVGRRPYTLEGRSAAEVERLVCEEEPTRPSVAATRAQHPADEKPDGASASLRSTTPERLTRVLRGDLDNIVMNAIRKEPNRRYSSVGLLLQDVENYLEGRPVCAHKDSRTYRIAKFVRRNKLETALAASIVVLLVSFSILSSVQARKLERERDRARFEMEKSSEVSSFVIGLFENANPTLAPGDAVTVREVLDAGRVRAETELAGQPLVQAELFAVMGRSYSGLGEPLIAADLLRRSVDIRRNVPGEEESFAADLLSLGEVYSVINKSEEAQQYLQEYIDLRGARLGLTHPDVLMASMHLMSSRHLTDPGVAADSMMSLWRELESQVVELEPERAAAVMSYVSDIQLTRSRYAEAEEIMVDAMAIMEREHGQVNAAYGDVMNRLAWILIEQNKLEHALEVATESVSIHETLYPDGHLDLATSYGAFGDVLSRLGRYDEADEALNHDLVMRERVLGAEHESVARSWRMLGKNEERRGNLARAEEYHRKGANIFVSMFGPDYVITRQYLLSVADVLFKANRYDEAEAIYKETYDVFLRDRGATDRYTREVAGDLSELYGAIGDGTRASDFRAKAAERDAG